MKILIVLPYKESIDKNTAGAVSIYVKDNTKYSRYKKKIKILSSKTIGKDKIFRNKTYIEKICKIFKNKKINIIEVHNRPEYIKYIRNNLPNAKIILVYHNDPLNLRDSSNTNDREYLINNCSKIVFCSKWIQQRFFSGFKNCNYTKTEIIYPSILKKKLIKIKKEKNILFVGKLNESKGYHIFVKAAELFKKNNNSWKFIAVGNEPRKKIFPDKDIVSEIGYLNNDDVLKLYEKSEIAVGNSVWNEPLGRIAIEASSRKCLPIISNVAGLKESKDIAHVLKSNNPKELYLSIKKFANNFKLRKKFQNKFYKSNNFEIKYSSKKIDEIRTNLLNAESNIKSSGTIKILHIANFNEVSDGRLFYSFPNKLNNGFIKNGNMVHIISDRTFLRTSKSILNPKGNIKLFNEKILNTLKNFSPDLLVIGHVFNIDPKIFDYCKINNIKTAGWFIDSISHEFFNGIKKKNFMRNLELLDKVFITSSPKLLKNIKNINKIKYIPNPCDSTIDSHKNFKKKKLDYDVFIALSHGQNRTTLKKGKIDEREKFISKITKKLPNIKFAEFGYNGVEPVWGSNFFYHLKKSKMALNISRGSYQNLYSSDRISSLIGNGLLVFINSKTNLQKLLKKNEVVYYKRLSDLISKIKFFKKNDKRRIEFSRKGYKKYHKYINSKLVSDFILKKTFNMAYKKKFLWERN